ncbi:glycosyl transferase [Bacillus sp. FJAT-27225]|uniref:glycosyltransferase family 32 protein n=1 Tax=Bacillus sp. FJAT-27225 TaxID=1743144 RepID=UPI00080C2BC3|nr:glycosyltransferase [Bacillus sp. FJAT-27225]OCA87889.1 glycosyl transferase [Bacillus sp. FJAT-27225]
MENIPKVVHYCWFGGNEKSELIKSCMESWKKYLPDYEIIEWNEENFDINSNRYVQEAYKEKKWAFVSDYVRLFALYHHGGIYLDTDVEIVRELDVFLDKGCFSGFESNGSIPTGIMGAVKYNPVLEELIQYYENRSFYLPNGKLDLTTNVQIITNICLERGFIPNGNFQLLTNGFHIYPKDYFCPKDYVSGNIHLTENSYCIHHFNGSWINNKQKTKKTIRLFLFSILGETIMNTVLKVKRKLLRILGLNHLNS